MDPSAPPPTPFCKPEPFPEPVTVLPTYTTLHSAQSVVRLRLDRYRASLLFTLIAAIQASGTWVGLSLQAKVSELEHDPSLAYLPAAAWYVSATDNPFVQGFRQLEADGFVIIDPDTATAYLTRAGLDRLKSLSP